MLLENLLIPQVQNTPFADFEELCFTSFHLWVYKHSSRQSLSIDPSIDNFITRSLSRFIYNFITPQPIPTPLNTFPVTERMTPIFIQLMTAASKHLVSCQHFHSLPAAFEAWQELINTSERLSFNPLANFSLRNTLLPRWL